MRNYNSDFLGDCCDNGEGLPEPCITRKELTLLLSAKADKVNSVYAPAYTEQINTLIAVINTLQARVDALEALSGP